MEGQTLRSCHWVLKIGNLKKMIDFLSGVLGLHALRHEEFSEGCEATCNGPYGGAWSKTMVGYGDEEHNFALELTYNYGIDSYAFGNDLQYICLTTKHVEGGLASAKTQSEAQGLTVTDVCEGVIDIAGPDNYVFRLVDHALVQEGQREEAFLCVGVRVNSLEESKQYWHGILGLQEQDAFPGCQAENTSSVTLCYQPGVQTALQLIEFSDAATNKVDHALSSGRLAFACSTVPPIFDMISSQPEPFNTVLTPPLTLPTPGKADVVVTILSSPSEYEICYVEDVAFYDLATPTYEQIMWEERAERGGDGHELKVESLASMLKREVGEEGGKEQEGNNRILLCEEPEDFEAFCQSVNEGEKVLIEFGAGWCKNCKRVSPMVHKLCSGNTLPFHLVVIDVNDGDEICESYFEGDITHLPHFVFCTKGDGENDDDDTKYESLVEDCQLHCKGEYIGSDEAEIQSFIEEQCA